MEYDLNFITRVISGILYGKNAERSDIANSCSYEPKADEKKISISKGTSRN